MQTDHTAHQVPFDLEEPIPIMFWDPLEFVLAVTLMGFGIVTNLFLLGLAGAAGVLVGAKYLKRGAKRGAMQHWLWALGLTLDKALADKFKAAYLNDFID